MFEDSLKLLGRHDARLLLPFLESEDPDTLINALHVFSEMRSPGAALIGPVLRRLGHPHPSVRWYTLDGLLLYLRRLPPKVLTLGLCLANDHSISVRKKVIEYISGIPLEKLEAACDILPSFVPRGPHQAGLKLLRHPAEIEALLEPVGKEDRVHGCYAAAAILKAAKSDNFVTIPDGYGDSEEVAFLRSKLNLMRTSTVWRARVFGSQTPVFEICPETLKIKGDLDGYGEVPDDRLEQAMGELDDSVKARNLEQKDRLPAT